MNPFSTEFPVSTSDNRAAFIAEVIAWLRGTEYSTVLSAGSEKELESENAFLLSPTNEEMRVRELKSENGWSAVGFRHDFPDNSNRLWRTEGVLTRSEQEPEKGVVRIRTQCIARTPGAQLESPKKPYLVKGLLNNGWGGFDSRLMVSDQAVFLEDNEDGLAMACAVALGEATKYLPTIYISATGSGEWVLTRDQIGKLAYDLGGIAHVVVEPDRAFSFRLRDASAGRNAYGGTIGLSSPDRAMFRRFYLGWQIQDGRELADAVRTAAAGLRSQMPAFGWDWTDLQEQALRARRERERDRLSVEEIQKIYDEEIENLQEKLRELEERLAARPAAGLGADEGDFFNENLIRRIGPEVYSGEISDRIRYAARTTLDVSEQKGIDERSKAILRRIVDRIPVSPDLDELERDIKRACTNPNRLAKELTSLLERHGYKKKSDNKHVRLEAKERYEGLKSVTVAKTPSEYRGIKNIITQTTRALGMTRLSD